MIKNCERSERIVVQRPGGWLETKETKENVMDTQPMMVSRKREKKRKDGKHTEKGT